MNFRGGHFREEMNFREPIFVQRNEVAEMNFREKINPEIDPDFHPGFHSCQELVNQRVFMICPHDSHT